MNCVIEFIQLKWRAGWSKFYRFLFEGKYKNVEIPKLHVDNDRDDLDAFLDSFVWTGDPWYQLFDVISYPGKILMTREDDCDGFAMFFLAALDGVDEKYMLTVSMRPISKCHSVCVYRKGGDWYHVGNWGWHGPFSSMEAVSEHVLDGNEIVLATIRDIDLNLVDSWSVV